MDTSFGELGLPPDLEEDSTSSNVRIAAIEESQRQFEERIGSQMQRMEQLLMTLIPDKDQKPAVTFQPTIPTAETPQKFKRRDSVDSYQPKLFQKYTIGVQAASDRVRFARESTIEYRYCLRPRRTVL